MSDVEVKKVFEMLWDCEFCETKGLLAKSQRCCPECGGKQNADKRYFPKEGEEVKIEGHKYEGADRYCPACNNPQGAAGKNCVNCGAPMDGSAVVKGVATPAPPPKPKSRKWILFVVIGVVAIIGIVLGVRHCNRTKDAGGKILAHAWERTVGIEEYGDDRQETWKNEVPRDARQVSCREMERSKKKVPTGEKKCKTRRVDNKDGTGREEQYDCKDVTRDEPVMDEKCKFVVTRWKEIEQKIAKGTGMTLNDPAGLPPVQHTETLGARRIGKKHDVYILQVEVPEADPKQQQCEVSSDAWKKHADGAKVTVQVFAKNNKVDCDKSF